MTEQVQGLFHDTLTGGQLQIIIDPVSVRYHLDRHPENVIMSVFHRLFPIVYLYPFQLSLWLLFYAPYMISVELASVSEYQRQYSFWWVRSLLASVYANIANH